MSKVKKLFQNPTLFLYDFCAKRLGKKNCQQQIISDEILCNKNKQTEQILSNINKLEGQYKELFRKIAPLIETEAHKELLQEEIKDIHTQIQVLESKTQQNIHSLERIEDLLLKLEKRFNARIPFHYADIRFALKSKTALECADFIHEHMQQKGVPFPWRNREQLLRYAASQTTLDGLILEFGVYKGISITILADVLKDKALFGFDSFEGLPETWRPGFEKGVFALKELPTVPQNVSLVKGLFEETLPAFLNEHQGPVAFLHVDCDLYSSTKCILSALKERIVSGTIILFDEFYNYVGWEHGEYKACSEFIAATGKTFSYIGYGQEQVVVIIE